MKSIHLNIFTNNTSNRYIREIFKDKNRNTIKIEYDLYNSGERFYLKSYKDNEWITILDLYDLTENIMSYIVDDTTFRQRYSKLSSIALKLYLELSN